jgi:hypothetical protein
MEQQHALNDCSLQFDSQINIPVHKAFRLWKEMFSVDANRTVLYFGVILKINNACLFQSRQTK